MPLGPVNLPEPRTGNPAETSLVEPLPTPRTYPVLASAGPVASPAPDPFARTDGPFAPSSSYMEPRQAGSVAYGRAAFRDQFSPNFGPLLFGGKRDLYNALGYPNDIFTWHYRTWYERGDIAACLIEFYPRSTWLPSVAVVENDDPDITTPIETEWDKFNRRLNVIGDVFYRADVLACTFRYSVIIIGAPGDLNTPLPRGTGDTSTIKYLTVLPEDRAYITQVVGQNGLDENGKSPGDTAYIDPVTSPRFGMPLTYTCKLGIAANYFTSDGINQQTGFVAEKDVHWSRIWHVAQGCLDNKIYGQPMLRRVANVLIDYYKLRGAVAEGVWRWADPKLHVDLDPSMELLPDEEAEYKAGIEALRHGQESVLRTRGVTVKTLYAPVVEMKENIMTLIRSIGASHGIPARVLSGSEEAKAAGAQDDKHSNDRQTERWGNFATPQLSGFLLYLADNGYMPVPKQLTVKWPEIEEHTEGEKAAIANQISLANLNQQQAGDALIMATSEMRVELYGREDPAPLPDPSTLIKPPVMTAATDPNNPNADPSDNPADSGLPNNPANNPADKASNLTALKTAMASAMASTDVADKDRRVLIIGGPRRGKSTLARELRSSGIPTFCGDPQSSVKDPEEGVTYLPENLAWSESSAYAADNWLTQPGPWCCEGVSMARAVRKLVNSDRAALLNGVEIVVLTDPAEGVTESAGQAVMSKGVMTVWGEVADLFSQARIITNGSNSQPNSQLAIVSASSSTVDDGTWRVSMPAGRTAKASRKNHKSSPRYCFRVL